MCGVGPLLFEVIFHCASDSKHSPIAGSRTGARTTTRPHIICQQQGSASHPSTSTPLTLVPGLFVTLASLFCRYLASFLLLPPSLEHIFQDLTTDLLQPSSPSLSRVSKSLILSHTITTSSPESNLAKYIDSATSFRQHIYPAPCHCFCQTEEHSCWGELHTLSP